MFLRAGILFLFLHPALIFAQLDSTLHHEVEVRGEGYFNSDAITNQFFKTLWTGGFIDDPMKERVLKRGGYISRWGADLSTGVNWSYNPDTLWGKTGLGMHAEINDRFHANGIFSEDLFRVAFYGNAGFAGALADLGNFRVNVLRYQQFQFGLDWDADSSRRAHGFSLSFLKGERHYQLDVKRGDLFTAADGTFIELDTKLQSFQSDTSKKGLLAFNGAGVSADMYWEFPYITWFHGGVLAISVYDLGFIAWNSRSMNHQLDTFLHFDGVEVNNLFDLQEGTFPQTDPDSLWNNNMHYRTGGYITWLPAILSITATTYYGKKFIVEKGINYRFNANARPFYFGSFSWNICPRFMSGINVSYGGYGRFNAGLEMELRLARRYKINLHSFYISGLAASAKFAGIGGNVALSARF